MEKKFFALRPREDVAGYVLSEREASSKYLFFDGRIRSEEWEIASVEPDRLNASQIVAPLSFLGMIAPTIAGDQAHSILRSFATETSLCSLESEGEMLSALRAPVIEGLLSDLRTEVVRFFPGGPVSHIVKWHLSSPSTNLPHIFRFAERRAGPTYVSETIVQALHTASLWGWRMDPLPCIDNG